LGVAYTGPLAVMLVWAAVLAVAVRAPLRVLGLLDAGQTAVAGAALVTAGTAGVAAYRRATDPVTRARLRWVAGGGALGGAVGLAGWALPELVTGRHTTTWSAPARRSSRCARTSAA